MSKRINALLGTAVAIFTIVAIFVLFAAAFGEEGGTEDAGRGSVFTVMFGLGGLDYDAAKVYPPIPALIVAFAFLCTAVVTSIASAIASGRIASMIQLVTALLLITAGIIFLCIYPLYKASLPENYAENLRAMDLGAGTICAVIFAFMGGALSAYGAYRNFKA